MPHAIGPVFLIVLLLVWSVYRRIRRNIGWQIVRPRRMIYRIVLLVVVAALLMVAGSASHPVVLLWAAAGLLVGSALAILGIRTTQMQIRNGAVSYRPNTWIGALLLVVFFARLAVRLAIVYQAEQTGTLTSQSATTQSGTGLAVYSQDPWTLSVFLVLAAYYIVYYILLMRKSRTLHEPQEARPSL